MFKDGSIIAQNMTAVQYKSLLLEEKVSPVRTLVTDVVENVTISPVVQVKMTIFTAHHISQKSKIFASFSSRRSLFYLINAS